MKGLFSIHLFLGLICGAVQCASAGTILNDWCVNLNGDINTACNGAGSGGPSGDGSISLAGFDTTAAPGLNSLGSVVITLGAGTGQSVAFYADYDLDYAAYGSFQDVGSAQGSLPADWSYELNDPNSSNIFSDFAAVPSPNLPDSNGVGTGSFPPDQCCDVSWALAISNIDIAEGDTGTVTFTVSTTVPTSGFYLQQTSFDAGNSIYLDADVSLAGSPTPEPSTFAMGLTAMGALALLALRRRRLSS